ncbi:hypothetical protein ACWNX6_00605 [Candidatus Vidania fulgoroideorum]
MYRKEVIIKNYNNKYIFFKCVGEEIAPYKINNINRSIVKIRIGKKIKVDILGENKMGKKIVSLKKYINKSIVDNLIKKKKILCRVIKEDKNSFKVEHKKIICLVPKKLFRKKPKKVLGKKIYFKINKIKKNLKIILSRDKFYKKERAKQINFVLKNRKILFFPVKITALTKYGVFSKFEKVVGLIKIRKFLLKKRIIRVSNYVIAKIQRYNNRNDRIIFLKIENLDFLKKIKKTRIIEKKHKFLIFKKKKSCINILKKVNILLKERREIIEKMILLKKRKRKIKNCLIERKKNYSSNKTNTFKTYKTIGNKTFVLLPFFVFGVIIN